MVYLSQHNACVIIHELRRLLRPQVSVLVHNQQLSLFRVLDHAELIMPLS